MMALSGFVDRLRGGLARSRDGLVGAITDAFARGPVAGPEFWEGIEEALLAADCGVPVTTAVVDELREVSRREAPDESALLASLADRLAARLGGQASPIEDAGRLVVMVVGVNGTGKTTTIAKLAGRSVAQGRSVLIGAADTFRAAATDQLEVWAERTGVEMISQPRGADPAAVTFDAVAAANARAIDRLFVDTAGRLHTKTNLMEELSKVKRVAQRESTAPVLTLLVLDANTGQNGLAQARRFHEALTVDGLAITKLDGTAKGGIALAIVNELRIPVWYVGVGETADDLMPFDARAFASALTGSSEGTGEETR